MNTNTIDYSVYLITNRPLCLGRNLLDIVGQAVQAGVNMVQLREKHAATHTFVELAQAVLQITRKASVPLIINDRIDVAQAVDADGVHIGQNDMDCQEVRSLLGPKKIIGLSVDTLEQLHAAKNLDVDYLGIGPVFPTTTKTDTEKEWGLDGIKQARQCSTHPFVGVGGITEGNAQDVVAAGAHGIAVVSAICSVPSPKQAVTNLQRAVHKGKALYAGSHLSIMNPE